VLTLIAVLALVGCDHNQAKPAQRQQPARTQLRQLLDAPVYYLTFRMHITASGAGAAQGAIPSSYSASITRDVEGDITLGGRSPGPSLSAMDMGAGADPTKLMDVDHYCTWMAGPIPAGEADTDANRMKYMNDAVMNYRGTVHYSSEFHSKQPISESDELEDVVTSKNYEGNALVSCPQPPMFEVNGLDHTFKLLVSYDFTDQSDASATGEEVTATSSSRGSNTTHTPIKQSLWMSRPVLEGSTEPTIKLEGKLPTSGAAISGSWNYPVVIDGEPGTMSITAVLAPARSEQVELIVTPPKDYDDWRPMGGNDEEDPGNSIGVTAHLQKVGGGVPLLKKIRKIEAKLLHTSNEKGVCMNWPFPADATNPLDMKFEQDTNKGYLIDGKGQTATDTTPQDYDAAVNVTCFDYGGTAELQFIATLNNGEQITGKVKGTSNEALYLPKRANANSFIALSYLKKYGVQSLSDDDDSESKPEGNGFNGDGLTLYEEYRGFREGGKWTTCNPKRKELMLVNEMRGEPHTWKGIGIYEAATKIKVHKYFHAQETNETHVINFNHTARAHVVDQHALYIDPGKTLAEGEHAARVRHVGPPGLAVDVSMPPDWKKWLKSGGRWQPDYAITIAHEMTHAASVSHHGNTDRKNLIWYVDAGPPLRWCEGNGHFDAADHQWVVDAVGAPVILKRENGTLIEAKFAHQFIPDVWLANPGGQHSGDNECVMKYNCATGYPSGGEPNTRYVTGDEYAGVVLCTAPAGTGVNDPSRSLPVGHPQSRQGPAELGDCTHQLCINDLFDPDAPPSMRTYNTLSLVAGKPNLHLPMQDDMQADVEQSSPFVAVGANDATDGSMCPGWPLIVSATVVAPDGSSSLPSAGFTPKVVSLSSGQEVPLALEAVPAPVGDNPATNLYWIAKPEATGGLVKGSYRITLTGQKGIDVAPYVINVQAPSDDSAAVLGLLKIEQLLITDKAGEALIVADQLIAANPINIGALTAKGDILLSQGKADEAMKTYAEALGYVSLKPATADATKNDTDENEMDEPLGLLQRLRDAINRVLTPTT
jgi:hypothetical protein